ncbi:MAG: peroxiredoxin [Zoogloeaceae bacterium]|jgi:peroxiredoxin Q/BCP|nr:peroxiredoxin [Zoogloeaceae bacterium]
MSLPAIGETLADFSLPATGGGTFRLIEQRGKTVVLYFYPKDNTSGCTTEAQAFRDRYADFLAAGALVAGISRDSLKSHENFARRQNLPFHLLSDADEPLCARFGVIRQKKLYGKEVRGIERSTFVLDRDGVLRREWRGVKLPNHVDEVLTFARTQ